jgi:inosine/xanthosine triphosphatase
MKEADSYRLTFAVGTTSERKNSVIKHVIRGVLAEGEFTTISYNAKSLVPDTPWDKETYDGARNRAIDCKANIQKADYSIGLESGLVDRYGQVYEEAWSCIIGKNGNEYYGYSSGLKVPIYIIEKMKELNMKHSELMHYFDQQNGIVSNDDTWGTYSQKMIIRDMSLSEALRNALVQIFAPKDSYYHK